MAELIIEVFDNDDNNTGIWHKGENAVDLADKACESIASVYDVTVTKVSQNMSGGIVADNGMTFRYEIKAV